ncbi:uncharacterized protein LOC122201179 [Panthera leo]|uniref:uncharacterized protein LOC122201179 n=1 Tax=Panthera leo TaxID=9689 RepID=UPI001C69BEB9|nr:uncharacterized protein LOC122201179 [Panthera leo]
MYRNMDLDTLQALQNELICSICMNYYIDPVTIDCGHSFCSPCLHLCWEEAQTLMSCPECRGISEKSDFKTNIALKKLASLARRARVYHANSSNEQICVIHKKAKEFFCEADKSLLCGLCSETPEHVAHGHSPVQWAAEEYREKLLKRMGSLWNMTQEMQNDLNQEANKIQSFEDYVLLRKVMIKMQYQKMHLFLREEEQLHLETLEKEAEEILQQLQESAFRITQQKASLKEMYKELTEMCHKPDLELLQDLGNVLQRTELVQVQKPQPMIPELTSHGITGILDILNNFRVDNVLSQEATGRYMCVSEDAGSVMFGVTHPGVYREPESLASLAAWGPQVFTSGKHYWEVDVTCSPNWILGVCKDSLMSDIDIISDPEAAFLLFSLKIHNRYSLSTNSPPLIQYVERPLGQIGVFLDYDNGTVSFYDVCKSSLIYSFLPSSFSFPLKPFLCFEGAGALLGRAFYEVLEIPSRGSVGTGGWGGGSRIRDSSGFRFVLTTPRAAFLPRSPGFGSGLEPRPGVAFRPECNHHPHSHPHLFYVTPDFSTQRKAPGSRPQRDESVGRASTPESPCKGGLAAGPFGAGPARWWVWSPPSCIPGGKGVEMLSLCLGDFRSRLNLRELQCWFRDPGLLGFSFTLATGCPPLQCPPLLSRRLEYELGSLSLGDSGTRSLPGRRQVGPAEPQLPLNMDSNIFQNEFTCSICVKYFIDPVTIGCGHSFCMPCLCIFWEEAYHPPSCPVCRETSHQTNFKTNIVLKTRVFLARRARPYHLPSSAEQMCEIHMKTKNFFCEVMKDLLCLLCCKSKEHEAHRHCSTDWTAEEYRQKLLKEMRSVWEKTQENRRNQKRESSKIRAWEIHSPQGYVSLRREMIRAEYRKVYHLLYEEERRYLERMEKESNEILQQLRASEDSMDQKGKALRGMYEDLKKTCHEPDVELLQHFENTLKRSESVQLHMPQPVDPRLSSWPITGLIERLNHFLVPIFFENETTTCHMPLFEDLRRWLFSRDHPDVVTNATRSKYFLAWGAQTFTCGQHYWEVDVGNCRNWALGFCDDSWTMRNDMALDSEGIFLLFCIKEDNQCRLFSSSPLSPQYVERPLGHVGVFLDYECGVVSFVNVANCSLICSFLSRSFCLPLRPFLCSAPS